MSRHTYIAFTLICIVALSVHAQLPLQWSTNLGGAGTDCALDAIALPDGIIFTGYHEMYGAQNCCLYKLDPDGNQLWMQSWGGDSMDQGNAIAQTPDGGLVIAGETNSFGAGWTDMWVIKTDCNGDTLWSRTLGDSGRDSAQDVVVTSSGTIVIAGYTNSWGAGNLDAWILCLDATGTVLWQQILGGTSIDEAHSITVASDGGYAVAGRTMSFGNGHFDAWLIKLDSLGNEQWTQTFGSSQEESAEAVIQTQNGDYAVLGSTIPSPSPRQIWSVRTDAQGNLLSQSTWGQGCGYAALPCPDGGALYAGSTQDFGANFEDAFLLRVDAQDQCAWITLAGEGGNELCYGLASTDDQRYIAVGSINSGMNNNNCLALLTTPDPGLATLCGTISNPQGAPIADATVTIPELNLSKMTDSAGWFEISSFMGGSYSVIVEHPVYETLQITQSCPGGQTTTLNLILTPSGTVSVSGIITGNDAPGQGLADAQVTLCGASQYATSSAADGSFCIPGVFADQSYLLQVQHSGFFMYQDTLQVANTSIDLGTIELIENCSPATHCQVSVVNNEATISWQPAAGGISTSFCNDDGEDIGEIGILYQCPARFGTAYSRDAIVETVQWKLHDEYLLPNSTTMLPSPHDYVIIGIYGLDASGLPDANELLFESTPVANSDNQWNSWRLPQPVDAPNGFLVSISTPYIYTSLAVDDGDGAPYQAQPGLHFVMNDPESATPGWDQWEDLSIHSNLANHNLLLRATGIDRGPAAASRQLTNYSCARLHPGEEDTPTCWTQLGTTTDTLFCDTTLATAAPSLYRYAVTANYDTGSSQPAFSPCAGLPLSLTVQASTNTGASAGGAECFIENCDFPQWSQRETLDDSGMLTIPSLVAGQYRLHCLLDGYEPYHGQPVTCTADTTLSIEIAEMLAPVSNLSAQVNGAFVSLAWNAPDVPQPIIEADFEDGTLPGGWQIHGYNTNTSTPVPGYWTVNNYTDAMIEPFGNFHAGLWHSNLHQDEWLETPDVEILPRSVLSFWSYNPISPVDENYLVEISTDAGATWEVIWDAANLSGMGTNYYNNAYIVDLSSFAGQTARLAFHASDGPNMGGLTQIWFIDNIAIYQNLNPQRQCIGYRVYCDGQVIADSLSNPAFIDQNVPAGAHQYEVTAWYSSGESTPQTIMVEITNATTPVTPEITLFNAPNPARATAQRTACTWLYFSLPSVARDVTLNIYNLRGQTIRTLHPDCTTAGQHQIGWDGCDADHKPVASGVYFYSLHIDSRVAAHNKMLLLR